MWLAPMPMTSPSPSGWGRQAKRFGGEGAPGAAGCRGGAEDYDLWLRMHQAGARFAKVPRILMAWREHSGRLTRTDARYSLENFLRAKADYLMLGPAAPEPDVLVGGA